MGGASDEIRGDSKKTVYRKYVERVAGWEECSWSPDPKCKKYCKRVMVQDS
jgi:hypothetical protein